MFLPLWGMRDLWVLGEGWGSVSQSLACSTNLQEVATNPYSCLYSPEQMMGRSSPQSHCKPQIFATATGEYYLLFFLSAFHSLSNSALGLLQEEGSGKCSSRSSALQWDCSSRGGGEVEVTTDHPAPWPTSTHPSFSQTLSWPLDKIVLHCHGIFLENT